MSDLEDAARSVTPQPESAAEKIADPYANTVHIGSINLDETPEDANWLHPGWREFEARQTETAEFGNVPHWGSLNLDENPDNANWLHPNWREFEDRVSGEVRREADSTEP
jgi:hypothetical protein